MLRIVVDKGNRKGEWLQIRVMEKGKVINKKDEEKGNMNVNKGDWNGDDRSCK